MKRFDLKTTCPFCYGLTSHANNLWRDDAPHNGDIAMCKFCGEMSIFSDRGRRLRKPNIGERKMIMSHPGAQTLRAAWQQAR